MHTFLDYQSKGFLLIFGIVVSFLISYFTIALGIVAPILSLLIGAILVFLVIVFRNPFIGLISTLVYCFTFILIGREAGVAFPYGYLVEGFYVLVWITIIFKTSPSDWSRVQNDLCLLFSLWFIISVLQLLNPEASARGWVSEIRTSGLDSFLLVPAGFLIFRSTKHLNTFIYVIIIFSVLAAFNSITQIHVGLTQGERVFVSVNPTHVLFGKLRAFSFYRDAGQFGASQAQLVVICSILTIGPFKLWKRILFASCALLFFYGMLLSGTRGSFFVLVPGIFLAIFLFKNLKVLILGLVLLLIFLAGLKYTHIGSTNYHIYRFRSALNPEDASLNVRFSSQEMLREYMKDYPFGGGLGVIGYAGTQFNSSNFLSTIAPDSYWVKVWAMYGIVGFTVWFCMMMFILGRCCGIVWNIEDEKLRIKLIALTSGFCGIFVCSYGNEVINALPSSIIVYLSLVLIYLGPEFDEEIRKSKLLNNI